MTRLRALAIAVLAFIVLVPVALAHSGLLDRVLPLVTGSLRTQGLVIHWGGTVTADSVELLDASGTYATFHTVKIVWSPLALIHRAIVVDSLTASSGDITRLPSSSAGSSSSGFPTKLSVKALGIGRLSLGKPVIGAPATVSLAGHGGFDKTGTSGAATVATLAGPPGSYEFSGSQDASRLAIDVTAKEAPGGLIATIAGLPDLGALDLSAKTAGPETALATAVTLSGGPLTAKAAGTVDLTARTLALHVTANAPAMTPRPDLAWQSVALDADASGAFDAPDVTGALKVEGLRAAGAGAQSVLLNASGNKGDVRLTGQLTGVTVPGKQPDILAAAPVRLTADAHMSAPGRPVDFTLDHPLIHASGTAVLDSGKVAMRASLPDLAPFAAEAGQTLAGHAALRLDAAREPKGAYGLDLTGSLGLTGGPAPAPALVGNDAKLALAAKLQGSFITLSHLTFDGRDVSLSGSGTLSSSAVDLSFAAALARLTPIDPRLAGALKAEGHVSGATTDLTLATAVTGTVSLEGQSSGPFTAHLDARGLPGAPTGSLTAQGALLGSPIDVALSGARSANGALDATIARADWKSLAANGMISLPNGATLPQGQLHLTIGKLSDLSPLLGRKLTGKVAATLDATEALWTVNANATNAGEPGTVSIGKAALRVTLAHPGDNPTVDGTLNLDGLKTGTVSGSARLTAKGPESALGLTLTADLANLDGAPARAKASGTADVPTKHLTLASFTGAWKGQDIRLLAPVRLGFAQGVAIDNLRLGIARAVIAVNGTIGKTLDLTASLRDVPASLASLVAPSLALSGTLNAQARVTGTTVAPVGTVRARATALRLDSATGRKLPAADLTATADLRGATARIDLRATAGASHLTVAGQAGLSLTAPLDLHADGSLDVAQADPLLGNGTRAAGRVSLAAAITGAANRPAGTVRVSGSGVRLLSGPGAGLPPASLAATATLQGTSARLDARVAAGSSHLGVTGTAGLSASGPLDLRINGSIDLALADPILQAGGQSVRGILAVNATVGGTTAAPSLTGGATLSGGDVRDYANGVHLSAVAARIVAQGDTLRIVSFDARAGKGTMAASGSVGVFAPGIPIDLTITARNATPIASDLLTATLGADLSMHGQLEGTVSLGGRVDVSRAVIQVPNTLPVSVVTIPVRIAGAPPPKPTPPSTMLATIRLDLTVSAPRQIFVRGRGLNAELGGTLHLAGTTKAMRSSGGFKLIRGSFNLVGNTLTFDSGHIDFNGTSITDPGLHLVATSVGSNMVATLTVSGTARDPKITLSSVPPLPQDQILGQLLFHTNAGALGPLQLASIAAGLAQISGQGGALTNPLAKLQNALGLDQLGVGTGPNGQPTLQAGRYLTKRIYVGAQQATGGAGAQGTVQVDLTKGLKLNATVGNGETTSAIGSTGAAGGASVGITYQFQY